MQYVIGPERIPSYALKGSGCVTDRFTGSWYRKDELARRSCIFHTSSGIGTMISGYLMAGVVSLDGTNGFKGWQWYVCLVLTSAPVYDKLTGKYIQAISHRRHHFPASSTERLRYLA